MPLKPSSRGRLTSYTRAAFSGDTLLDSLGRVLSDVGCLPRKELFEAWAVAKRVRRRFRGGSVVEMAAGHGLLAHILLLLDPGAREAVCVDRRRPANVGKLWAALAKAWPRLGEQTRYVESDLGAVEIPPDALVVSIHACGRLTDRVIDRAVTAQVRVAVLPCCHRLRDGDTGGLEGWMTGALAIDAVRAQRLRTAGYTIHTQTIPDNITPQNRLLLGAPPSSAAHTPSRVT